MNKIPLWKKRIKAILEIMKKDSYKQGITYKEIQVELMNLSYFGELYGENPKHWKDAVRQLLQFGCPDMKNHKTSHGNIFFRITPGLWTYWENNKFKSFKDQRNQIKAENDELENFLKKLQELDYSDSEIHALVKVRKNQTNFRKFLIKEFNQCPIKKVKLKSMLIASHIIDYKDCENEFEKSNPFNGILLSPDADKLFDRKIITFDPKRGNIIIKNGFELDVYKMGFTKNSKLPEDFLNETRGAFLEIRNKKYF